MSTFNRNRTVQEWADSTDVIPLNVAVYETDGMGRHKYGNGVDTWSNTPFPETSSTDKLVWLNETGELKTDDGEVIPIDGTSPIVDSVTIRDLTDQSLHILTIVDGELLLDGSPLISDPIQGGTP